MRIIGDLHSHSVFAGGAGAGTIEEKTKIAERRFYTNVAYSSLKGVDLLGTGDVQFEPYLRMLKSKLDEVSRGIYEYTLDEEKLQSYTKQAGVMLKSVGKVYYILQTEVILTAPVSRGRKKSHVLILFPDFGTVIQFNTLLDLWGVKRKNMPRPFIVCKNIHQIAERIHKILDINELIEIIPAHVMTPEGVYGGSNGVDFLEEFFGSAHTKISAVETGLSADPTILGMIPELDKKTLISNADAHSSALNRIAREFTVYDLKNLSYRSLIDTIRNNKVIRTAEFHPTEGRYFLTGHRSNRKKPALHSSSQYCYYSPAHLPPENKCPVCGKSLTIGVLQRALEVSESQGQFRLPGDGPERKFTTMVPLVEVIAHALGLKSSSSKKVIRTYYEIIQKVGSESTIWTDGNITQKFADAYPEVYETISQILEGRFYFSPPGYDGNYGRLAIGEQVDYLNIKVEHL